MIYKILTLSENTIIVIALNVIILAVLLTQKFLSGKLKRTWLQEVLYKIQKNHIVQNGFYQRALTLTDFE